MPKTRLISPGIANHSLKKNLILNDNYISNDGGDEGIRITDTGNVGIGVSDPDTLLEVYKVGTQLKLSGGAADYATFAVAADGALTITTVDADDANGDIILAPDGNIFLHGTAKLFSGDDTIWLNPGTPSIRMRSLLNTADYFQIAVDANAATTITTLDAVGSSADLTINANGEMKLDSYGATGTAEAVSEPITMTPGTFVHINKDLSETTASSAIKGLHVDIDRTGDVSTGTDTTYGIDIDVDHTGASGGTISSYGMTLTVAGDTGTAYGMNVHVSGSDTCNGIVLNNKDGGTDFFNASSASAADYFTLNTIEDGETTLTTVENGGGSTAHLNMVADGNFTVDAAGDISLDAGGGDVTILQADLTIPSTKKVILGAVEEYIKGDGTDITIGVGSGGDINIPAQIGLTFGADTEKIEVDGSNNLEIDASGNITLDAEGDIILNANGGNIQAADGLSTYVPTAAPDITNKAYVDTQVNCPNIPFFFNETTTSRTYFRNADDVYNAWEWDGYDTEDSTSVDATIDISTGNLMAGYVVPVACTFIRALWVLRQANAVIGTAHFQIWTGSPVDDTEVTLRTTNELASNRTVLEQATSTVAISLSGGDMVYPAIQYVSGTSTIWYGSVTLMFERA